MSCDWTHYNFNTRCCFVFFDFCQIFNIGPYFHSSLWLTCSLQTRTEQGYFYWHKASNSYCGSLAFLDCLNAWHVIIRCPHSSIYTFLHRHFGLQKVVFINKKTLVHVEGKPGTSFFSANLRTSQSATAISHRSCKPETNLFSSWTPSHRLTVLDNL